MSALTIRELNSNISRAIARVEAGETLDILKNGKVVAELRPKPRQTSAAWRKAYKGSVDFMSKGLDLRVGKLSPEDKYGNVDL